MNKDRPMLSPVIAGCMNWGQWGSAFSTGQYERLIHECIDAGITTFDHADIYGSYTTEKEFGHFLLNNPSLRNKMQLITKCGIKMISANRPGHTRKSYDSSAKHILASVERSLTNFHTDCIDILLLHRPDPLMHPDEIAAVFTQLKKEGKILHFGVSNFTTSQASLIHSRFPVGYNQLEVSAVKLDAFHNGQLDQCLELGIQPMAWSPLGGGRLMKAGSDERNDRILAAANQLTAKYHCTTDQVLLSFLFQHPSGIIPVLGTTKIERLVSGLQAAEIKMEREDWFMLWQASAGYEVP